VRVTPSEWAGRAEVARRVALELTVYAYDAPASASRFEPTIAPCRRWRVSTMPCEPALTHLVKSSSHPNVFIRCHDRTEACRGPLSPLLCLSVGPASRRLEVRRARRSPITTSVSSTSRLRVASFFLETVPHGCLRCSRRWHSSRASLRRTRRSATSPCSSSAFTGVHRESLQMWQYSRVCVHPTESIVAMSA